MGLPKTIKFKPRSCGHCNALLNEANQNPVDRKAGRRICKQCHREKAYKWKLNNRERYNTTVRAWAKANRSRLRILKRAEKLKRVYGISFEEFERRLALQDGVCANRGCLSANPGPLGWCIDHNHRTGKIRGILCRNCNLILGIADDSIDRLSGAIEYLSRDVNEYAVG